MTLFFSGDDTCLLFLDWLSPPMFFYSFSLKIHVGHLKFQNNPLSCMYLSDSPQSFDLRFFSLVSL